MFLYPACDRRCKFAADQRILGIVLKIPAAADIAVNVQRGRKPQMHAEAFHLVSDQIPERLRQSDVPALCNRGSDWNRGAVLIPCFIIVLSGTAHHCHDLALHRTQQFQDRLRHRVTERMDAGFVLIILPADAKPRRAVRHNQRGKLTHMRRLSRRSRDRHGRVSDHASHAALGIERADVEIRQFLIGKRFDCRIRLRFFIIGHRLCPECIRIKDDAPVRFGHFSPVFRLPVGKVHGTEFVLQLLQHNGSAHFQRHRRCLPCKDRVIPCLQDPRRPFLIIGCGIRKRIRHSQRFAFSGQKFLCLFKRQQFPCRLIQFALRHADVQFNDLFSGILSDILNGYGDG